MKTEVLRLRLTEAERVAFFGAAMELGLSLSAWAREVLNAEIDRYKTIMSMPPVSPIKADDTYYPATTVKDSKPGNPQFIDKTGVSNKPFVNRLKGSWSAAGNKIR